MLLLGDVVKNQAARLQHQDVTTCQLCERLLMDFFFCFPQFAVFANTIEDSFKFNVRSIFRANRALARDIATSASTTNSEFPHFSIPAFEAYAYDARTLAGFEVITYAPVAVKRREWTEFAQSSRGWLDESKRIFDILEPGQNRSAEPPVAELPMFVFNYGENGTLSPLIENTLFVPSLHISPPPFQESKIYQNINMFSQPDYREVSFAAVSLQGKEWCA